MADDYEEEEELRFPDGLHPHDALPIQGQLSAMCTQLLNITPLLTHRSQANRRFERSPECQRLAKELSNAAMVIARAADCLAGRCGAPFGEDAG